MEQPQYVLKPHAERVFIPISLGLALLAVLIYFGVYLNLKILGIELDTLYRLAIIVVAIILVGFGLLETYGVYLKSEYYFYRGKAYIAGKWVDFKDISEVTLKRNIIDRLFGTATILLSPVSKIKFVPNSPIIYDYVRKLVRYSNQKI